MSIYYVSTDENGVDCIDQIDMDPDSTPEELATFYPETIYFEYEATNPLAADVARMVCENPDLDPADLRVIAAKILAVAYDRD